MGRSPRSSRTRRRSRSASPRSKRTNRGDARSRDRAGVFRRSKSRSEKRSRSRDRKGRQKSESSSSPRDKKTTDDDKGSRNRKGNELADSTSKTTSTTPGTASTTAQSSSSTLPPPRTVRIQSFEEILAAVRAGAMPSVMPARAGSAFQPGGHSYAGIQLPARPLYDIGYRGSQPRINEDCAQAPPEVLARAKEQAKLAETAGREAARLAGGAPRGPPGLPTGVHVVEQKFVEFLIGPGGQSLASINYAAGVNVILDQTHKFSGYSFANIYGQEESSERAKLAIDFKLSQWLPRGGGQNQGLWIASPTMPHPPGMTPQASNMTSRPAQAPAAGSLPALRNGSATTDAATAGTL